MSFLNQNALSFSNASLNRVSYFFSDLFDSDNWTDTGAFTGVSGGVLTGSLTRSGTNHGSTIALSSAVSDTLWIMRFPITITTNGGTDNNTGLFFLSDSGLVGVNTSADRIGLGGMSATSFSLLASNGSYTTSGQTTFGTPSAGTYYTQIARTSSTTAIATTYSGSDYTSQIATSGSSSVSSSVTGLDNLVVQSMNDGGAGASWVISILEVFIKDGQSTW